MGQQPTSAWVLIVRPNFQGVLAKGTPVAQCVPVKREVWSSRFEVIAEEAAVQINDVKWRLSKGEVYRG